MMRAIFLLPAGALLLVAASPGDSDYRQRVDEVRRTPGFVALWDFVKREPGGVGRFDAWQANGDRHDFRLDAVNYVRDYWNRGRPATYDDFPLLGRGPFGQAIQLRRETDADFRPCLLIPRARLHDSGLDVKGAGRSVSMAIWLVRESGNHALAGIWHEGTDLATADAPARKVERGMRQYALFAGLAGNNGGVAAHVSENGGASFSDRYARNLAVTREVMPATAADSPPEALDRSWQVAAFSFDNARHTVTAYLDGIAQEFWIDDPKEHPFYRWPYKGWVQAQLQRIPGPQPGEDPAFPKEQFYEPPEGKPLKRVVLEQEGGRRVELHTFRFTKVRVTLERDARGRFAKVVSRELVSIKANPFWFGHDLYSPAGPEDGGPFTIGRVIHSSRSVGFTGYLGGVAVFDGPLSAGQMRRLAAIGRNRPIPARR
jgi:hypothetical protein